MDPWLHPQKFWLSRSGVWPEICVSNSLPSSADNACQENNILSWTELDHSTKIKPQRCTEETCKREN